MDVDNFHVSFFQQVSLATKPHITLFPLFSNLYKKLIMSQVQQSVLAHLIRHPYDIRLLPADAAPDFFSEPLPREIFEAIWVLYKKNIRIDIPSIVDWLSFHGSKNFTKDDYHNFFNILIHLPDKPETFPHYLRLFVAIRAKKKLKEIGATMTDSATFQDQDIETVINDAILQLSRLRNGFTSSVQDNHREEGSQIFYRVMRDIAQPSAKQQHMGLPSGFPELDAMICGWQEGDLVVVGARPGMGKTSFLLSTTNHLLRSSQIPVLYFTTDVSPERVMWRLISNSSGMSELQLQQISHDNNKLTEIHSHAEHLADANFFPECLRENSIEEILSIAERYIYEKKIKIVYIDFLQQVTVGEIKFRSRDAELGYITRQLKIFARRNKIPVVAASQLSREVERRPAVSHRPILSDLRDSGSIEQDASKVIFIYRPEYYGLEEDEFGQSTKGLAHICVAKNKSGNCEDIQLNFDGKCSRFTEREKSKFSFNSLRKNDFDDEPPF